MNSLSKEAQISVLCQYSSQVVIERAIMLYRSSNILFSVVDLKKKLYNFLLLEKLRFLGLQCLRILMRNIQGKYSLFEGKNAFSVSRKRYSCVISEPNYENSSQTFFFNSTYQSSQDNLCPIASCGTCRIWHLSMIHA